LLGLFQIEAWLIAFRKIPFACSWLPGKSKIHLAFVSTLQLLPLVLLQVVEAEQWAASRAMTYIAIVAALTGAIVIIRKLATPSDEILYEDFASDELIGLNLGS
jgi:hypothetical protein